MNGAHQVMLFKILFHFMCIHIQFRHSQSGLLFSGQDAHSQLFLHVQEVFAKLNLGKTRPLTMKCNYTGNRDNFVLIAVISFRLLSTSEK